MNPSNNAIILHHNNGAQLLLRRKIAYQSTTLRNCLSDSRASTSTSVVVPMPQGTINSSRLLFKLVDENNRKRPRKRTHNEISLDHRVMFLGSIELSQLPIGDISLVLNCADFLEVHPTIIKAIAHTIARRLDKDISADALVKLLPQGHTDLQQEIAQQYAIINYHPLSADILKKWRITHHLSIRDYLDNHSNILDLIQPSEEYDDELEFDTWGLNLTSFDGLDELLEYLDIAEFEYRHDPINTHLVTIRPLAYFDPE